MEGVEEVWEEVMMDMSDESTKIRSICHTFLKRFPNALDNREKKESKIKYCKGNEKVGEVAFQLFSPKHCYGKCIGTYA